MTKRSSGCALYTVANSFHTEIKALCKQKKDMFIEPGEPTLCTFIHWIHLKNI